MTKSSYVSIADVIDPAAVVDPFLAILRAPYLAGPFKLVALDALQTLTNCKIFIGDSDSCRKTLAAVVDAVTRLVKFFLILLVSKGTLPRV